MVKHIVMWKLKESAHGNTKEQNAKIIKEKLESLNGKIPGMLALEVGIDFSCTESSSDVVLYSAFASRKDLDNYQEHPEHKAVMPFIMEARTERRVVDYEA
jgi:hypothetical protein